MARKKVAKAKVTKKKVTKEKAAKEKEVGTIFGYYSKIGVAAIKMNGKLSRGDEVHIKGHTTDFKQKVDSIQIKNKDVASLKAGDEAGIKVKDKVRPNDKIYKVE